MNKFHVLIASLMVFAVVAQLARADGGELQSEIPDDDDVDDELEGGIGDIFKSSAKSPVGHSSVEAFGYDFLDKNKGIQNLVDKRVPECKSATSKQACTTCCAGLDKSSEYSRFGRFTRAGGCTCFSRDNQYGKSLP